MTKLRAMAAPKPAEAPVTKTTAVGLLDEYGELRHAPVAGGRERWMQAKPAADAKAGPPRRGVRPGPVWPASIGMSAGNAGTVIEPQAADFDVRLLPNRGVFSSPALCRRQPIETRPPAISTPAPASPAWPCNR